MPNSTRKLTALPPLPPDAGCAFMPAEFGAETPPLSPQKRESREMQERLQFYIDGKWVNPVTPKTIDVINPANEEAFARVSLGSKADVDKAVAAARKAFET